MKREEYPAYFDERPGGRLVHVSVAVRDVAGWLAEAAEPVEWALAFPAAEAMRLMWAADDCPGELLALLDRAYLPHPSGDPELEDFLAALGKVRHARAQGNDLALRLAAQVLARLCPSVLQIINPEVRVGTRHEALLAALALPVSPPSYREDMLVCLGLSGDATTGDEVGATAERLVRGVLELMRPCAARLAAHVPPALLTPLADGTLQRYVTQAD